MRGQKLSLKRVELQALLAPQRSAPPPRSFARSFLKFCMGQQGSPARTAAPRPKPGLTPPPPLGAPRAAAQAPPPAPPRLVGPAPVSTPPPGAAEWRRRPQDRVSSDKRAGGGGSGRAQNPAPAPPSTARRNRPAPSAPGPHRAEKRERQRRLRGGGGGAGGGGAAGRGCRFVVRPGPRKEKWEEGGARRPAPSAAHGDDARHIRDPPAVAAAAPAARAPAPAAVVTAPRLTVAPAPPAARRPRAPRRGRSPAAAPAAGDMSNPGGRRNGPVKLRLTGEGVGRAAGARPGRRRGGRAGGGCLWP